MPKTGPFLLARDTNRWHPTTYWMKFLYIYESNYDVSFVIIRRKFQTINKCIWNSNSVFPKLHCIITFCSRNLTHVPYTKSCSKFRHFISQQSICTVEWRLSNILVVAIYRKVYEKRINLFSLHLSTENDRVRVFLFHCFRY